MTDSTDAALTAQEKYPRRANRKRQTRERILEAARKLFQSRGYDDVKMTDIADEADVHVTTMFIHFKTKRDLAASLSEAEVDELQALIDDAQGRIPFFKFFRNVVTRWATGVQKRGSPGTPFGHDLKSDPELAFSWLGYHKREIKAYARYFAADHDLEADDTLPYLVATMLTGGNVMAHDRWMRSEGKRDLVADVNHSIDLCQAMVEAAFDKGGKPKFAPR